MIPNPIHKVLSSIRRSEAQTLLMGGQACVLYGAAEFSRDVDLAILVESANLLRLQGALEDLEAVRIAVPRFEADYLERGHAVHFRCSHPDAAGIRVDVMAKMRGVDRFEELWGRRTTITLEDGLEVDVLALPDLVQAKKTQRDKDWPMIRRLVEANYFSHRRSPSPEQIRFWFRELRTPDLLVELARRFEDDARREAADRPAAAAATVGDAEAVARALRDEEETERQLDARYWQPLREELVMLRRR